ncbi:MAG: hypothetical protein HY589_02315 [Candidatus Omnitrophica bacterium]|nr:hypothetical protein [Candidatus Omnitrophota bacterium]
MLPPFKTDLSWRIKEEIAVRYRSIWLWPQRQAISRNIIAAMQPTWLKVTTWVL